MNALYTAIDNLQAVANTLHTHYLHSVAAEYPRAIERLNEAREAVAATTTSSELAGIHTALENALPLVDRAIDHLDMDSHTVQCRVNEALQHLRGLAWGLAYTSKAAGE